MRTSADRVEIRPYFNAGLEEAVTLRYDACIRDPAPDWRWKLEGRPDLADWMSDRLDR